MPDRVMHQAVVGSSSLPRGGRAAGPPVLPHPRKGNRP